jgi:hypothetical protein
VSDFILSSWLSPSAGGVFVFPLFYLMTLYHQLSGKAGRVLKAIRNCCMVENQVSGFVEW